MISTYTSHCSEISLRAFNSSLHAQVNQPLQRLPASSHRKPMSRVLLTASQLAS